MSIIYYVFTHFLLKFCSGKYFFLFGTYYFVYFFNTNLVSRSIYHLDSILLDILADLGTFSNPNRMFPF